MPSFTYIARTNAGTLEKGTIDASSTEDAREKLRKRQLMVEELQEESASGGSPVGFVGAMPWTTTDDDAAPVAGTDARMADTADYIPLTDTLRLFAGWLLAWYGLVYLLGSYRLSGRISADIPFIQGLFESPVVLRFAFGTFLFLLLTNIHQWWGKGVGKGIVLGIIGIALFAGFHFVA